MSNTEYVKTIECPKCRLKNIAGSKFCDDCGTPLISGSPLICVKCRTANTSNAKFCNSCGNSLSDLVENDPDIRLLQNALKGRYIIEKPLGEGGFGRVFLAMHEGLKRKDVIKLLGADQSRSEDIKKRFLQEAQAIAKLSHPNIIEIKDVSEADGRPFYIMAYREGGSLEDLLQKEKKLSPERAIELTKGILNALYEVHKKGIIHRDIKPDNILLGEKGEPILIDFGIARMEEESIQKPKTGTGMTIGTVTYMSPEQLEGKKIDIRTDLYSVGILLYELLTGEPPFKGSLSSLIIKHTREPIPNISEKINNINFSPILEYVIKKACEKNPKDRYSSANEMKEGLEQRNNKTILEFNDKIKKEDNLTLEDNKKNSIFSLLEKYKSSSLKFKSKFIIIIFILLISVALNKIIFPKSNIIIKSEPSKAEVISTIDGKLLGTTPYEEYKKEGGTYSYLLKLKGYKSETVDVKLIDDTDIKTGFAMLRDLRNARLDSDPIGVKITGYGLEGKAIEDKQFITGEITPYHGVLNVGKYELIFSKEGFYPEKINLNIESKGEQIYSIVNLMSIKEYPDYEDRKIACEKMEMELIAGICWDLKIVSRLNWIQAVDYCNINGKRLPSKREFLSNWKLRSNNKFKENNYWTIDESEEDSNEAYYADITFGFHTGSKKTNKNSIICIK